jgi:hypothetical protein
MVTADARLLAKGARVGATATAPAPYLQPCPRGAASPDSRFVPKRAAASDEKQHALPIRP